MGGRGRGRGGGRGGARVAPVVMKDDDGNAIVANVAGPPPLFPEHELPKKVGLDAEQQRLLTRKRALLRFWNQSPYFLEPHEDNKGVSDPAGLSSTTSISTTRGPKSLPSSSNLPLSDLLTLAPHLFPAELYSTREQKAAARAASAKRQKLYWDKQARKGAEGEEGWDTLDKLAQRENAAAGDEVEDEGGEGKKRAGEEDQEEEPMEVEEEEDDFPEDDDYYQGDVFDDDEGYDDGYDDAGDEGPVF